MAAWVPFGVLTLALIGILLLLSIVSARAVEATATVADRSTALESSHRPARTPGRHGTEASDPRLPRFEPPGEPGPAPDREEGSPEMSTGDLLANVALTQGLFGAAVLAAAFYFAIPLSTLGIETPLVATESVLMGIGFGLLLWLGNEVAAAVADAAGVGYDESVRSMLSPDSVPGWLVLLGVILPVIAVVEELLFRGAAIGALSAGFAIPEPVLVVASSLVFGGAHGAQGRIGAVVATGMGLLLGTAFVLTGSLLVVVIAHYIVNGLEFVVHEGLEVDRPLSIVDPTARIE